MRVILTEDELRIVELSGADSDRRPQKTPVESDQEYELPRLALLQCPCRLHGRIA